MLALLVLLILIALVAGGIMLFMRQPVFGKPPTGERLSRIENSSNYREGAFQNLSATPMFIDGESTFSVMRKFVFRTNKQMNPPARLPSQKTDLKKLDPATDLLVWFGHSSYYLQIAGKRILVDPVLSGHASPVSFTTRSFAGSDVYKPEDFPEIDYLLLSHDHFDHLDYKAVVQLRPKIGRVITGLGVGEHLEHWGYDATQITELDWNESTQLANGISLTATPDRHFSGRTFKRNGSLWLSFVLSSANRKLFIGGDSGYDSHFAAIGREHGPFDLAILENGQYNESWKHIHMMPEQVVQAAMDLQAKRLMPVHWSKFALSLHSWDEPILRAAKEAKLKNMPLAHPMIGEVLYLDDMTGSKEWWKDLI